MEPAGQPRRHPSVKLGEPRVRLDLGFYMRGKLRNLDLLFYMEGHMFRLVELRSYPT